MLPQFNTGVAICSTHVAICDFDIVGLQGHITVVIPVSTVNYLAINHFILSWNKLLLIWKISTLSHEYKRSRINNLWYQFNEMSTLIEVGR